MTSLRARSFLPRHYLAKKLVAHGDWVNSTRRNEPSKLNEVDSALAVFDLRNPAVRNA
jgi:hypothetical protein